MGEGAGKSRAEEELDRIGQCVVDLSSDWVLSYRVSYPLGGGEMLEMWGR